MQKKNHHTKLNYKVQAQLCMLSTNVICNQLYNHKLHICYFLNHLLHLSSLQHLRSGSNFECAYRTHLMAAQGFYHHLLLRIQKEFNLHLSCAVDFVYSPTRDWGVGQYDVIQWSFVSHSLHLVSRACLCFLDTAKPNLDDLTVNRNQ